MKRRDFIKLISAVGLSSLTGGYLSSPTTKSLSKTGDMGKPNFLFILADDCTFRDIGCYGGQAHTPDIDQLAKDGIRFTHSFQAAPRGSPQEGAQREDYRTAGLSVLKRGLQLSRLFHAGPQERSVQGHLL